MTTFHFDLVAPDKLLFSGSVTQVDLPGEEGDVGLLAGHAPYVATLKPGVLTIYDEGAPKRLVVRGGFAEMSLDGNLTILAEQAVPVEELDAATINQAIKDAEEDLNDAKDSAARDKAAIRLDRLRTLQSALGH